MKKTLIFLFIFCLGVVSCTPQPPEITQTSEVFSPTGDASTIQPGTDVYINPPANTTTLDVQTNTASVTSTADLTRILVGEATQWVINFTNPNQMSCNVYKVLGQDKYFTTDPSSCLPNVPVNNPQWATALENINLRQGTPVPWLTIPAATGAANPGGFSVDPDDNFLGLQYRTVRLGYTGQTLIVWVNAVAAQQVIDGGNTSSSNGSTSVETQPPGSGGNCTPPLEWDPDLQTCVDDGNH